MCGLPEVIERKGTGMDVNYELYKVFYYVASLLSFSEASRKLYISQSAVSQSVKLLEKKLNCTLFVRSTKKVQLTPEGEILLRYIEPAINMIKRGETQLMEADSLNGGQLRIGASDTICRYYLLPFLNQFHREHPNVHINVTNQSSIRCVELLNNGQVDFIVVNYPNSLLMNENRYKIVKEFQDVFVAGEKYSELKDNQVSLKELQNYPILMLDRKSTTSEYLRMIFEKNQLELIPEIEISSNDLLLDLARIGLGITFVPDYCIPKEHEELFRLETKETIRKRQLAVAYNDKLPLSQAAEYFIGLLGEL